MEFEALLEEEMAPSKLGPDDFFHGPHASPTSKEDSKDSFEGYTNRKLTASQDLTMVS